MCGICGYINKSSKPANVETVDKMCDALAHRGPDGAGHYIHNAMGIGHRRLSIIDLSGGGQPIGNEDNSLQIVFNGEIYNYIELAKTLESKGHTFRTHSDTEVIIHAYEEWGEECVKRFNGMFAFAILDTTKNEVFIARDHLGIKPLYYTETSTEIIFASEIKALLTFQSVRKEVDHHSLTQLFALRYVPSPGTLFKNIRKLPPANFMLIKDGSVAAIKCFWDTAPNMQPSRNEQEAVEEYRALLEDAVRIQMRSDVPVGLFLSSGVDSAMLLALMSKHSTTPINTFTIGFSDATTTDETAGARWLSSQFGSSHHELTISHKDYISYYSRYLNDLEEPVGNESAAAFYFVSKLSASKVKVTLTGQGADEPWGGYRRYLGAKYARLYQSVPHLLRRPAIAAACSLFPANERLQRIRDALHETNPLRRMVKIYSFYSEEMREQLFRSDFPNRQQISTPEVARSLEWVYKRIGHLDDMSQMMYADVRTNLPDDLLMVGDKTSMANSLEVRVPFLDYRIIEFAERLPGHLKVNLFNGKHLHKLAAEKWLPKKLVYARKKGFANPVDKWLKDEMSNWTQDLLLSPNSASCHYFNRTYIEQLLNSHKSRRMNAMRHLYLLISFELWHRNFIN